MIEKSSYCIQFIYIEFMSLINHWGTKIPKNPHAKQLSLSISNTYMYNLLDLKFIVPIFFGQVFSYIVKHIKELRVKILEWTWTNELIHNYNFSFPSITSLKSEVYVSCRNLLHLGDCRRRIFGSREQVSNIKLQA